MTNDSCRELWPKTLKRRLSQMDCNFWLTCMPQKGSTKVTRRRDWDGEMLVLSTDWGALRTPDWRSKTSVLAVPRFWSHKSLSRRFDVLFPFLFGDVLRIEERCCRRSRQPSARFASFVLGEHWPECRPHWGVVRLFQWWIAMFISPNVERLNI